MAQIKQWDLDSCIFDRITQGILESIQYISINRCSKCTNFFAGSLHWVKILHNQTKFFFVSKSNSIGASV